VRLLVDRRTGVHALGIHQEPHGHHGQQPANVVGDASTLVARDGVPSMTALDVGESRRHFVERFFPADVMPLAVDLLDRRAKSIRVGVHVLQAGGLGANVALAEDVSLIASDREDLLLAVLDGNPTHGFAQGTGSKVGLAHVRSAYGLRARSFRNEKVPSPQAASQLVD
jgi:hypothetical protein